MEYNVSGWIRRCLFSFTPQKTSQSNAQGMRFTIIYLSYGFYNGNFINQWFYVVSVAFLMACILFTHSIVNIFLTIFTSGETSRWNRTCSSNSRVISVPQFKLFVKTPQLQKSNKLNRNRTKSGLVNCVLKWFKFKKRLRVFIRIV